MNARRRSRGVLELFRCTRSIRRERARGFVSRLVPRNGVTFVRRQAYQDAAGPHDRCVVTPKVRNARPARWNPNGGPLAYLSVGAALRERADAPRPVRRRVGRRRQRGGRGRGRRRRLDIARRVLAHARRGRARRRRALFEGSLDRYECSGETDDAIVLTSPFHRRCTTTQATTRPSRRARPTCGATRASAPRGVSRAASRPAT